MKREMLTKQENYEIFKDMCVVLIMYYSSISGNGKKSPYDDGICIDFHIKQNITETMLSDLRSKI